MNGNTFGGGAARLARSATLAIALGLAPFAAACGGSGDREGDVAEDTLGLLDSELDLAMSGEHDEAQLRDEPQGRRVEERDPGRTPAARPTPPPPPSEQVAGPEPPSAEAEGPGVRVEGRSIAGGTTFDVTLNQELSTRTSQVGDLYSATLVHPLTDGRLVIVPAGATVLGQVTVVQKSGGQGQQAVLNLSINEVSFDGETYPLQASIVEANPETRSRSSTGAKAAKIGGAAVAGAILGGIIGGNATGAIIGTAVGGAAGTAIVLGTEDVDAVLPRGSRMTLRLDAPLEIQVELP
ncbi:MAG: hypothetical protein O7E50_04205 [Gemmatimonadetes bacterium]|nr:hypothetical protein [Gemmatimonadota bacterium]